MDCKAAWNGSGHTLHLTRRSFAVVSQSHSQNYGFNKSDDRAGLPQAMTNKVSIKTLAVRVLPR